MRVKIYRQAATVQVLIEDYTRVEPVEAFAYYVNMGVPVMKL